MKAECPKAFHYKATFFLTFLTFGLADNVQNDAVSDTTKFNSISAAYHKKILHTHYSCINNFGK